MKRCQLTAMTVGLVYNWWSLFVSLANPDARMEAITSRPFLLAGVGRRTEHAGQAYLSTTPLHGKNKQAREMLTSVSAQLQQWKRSAEQLNCASVWLRVCQAITTLFTGINWLEPLQKPILNLSGVG